MINTNVVTYGKCTQCGEKIPTTELKFLPEAEEYFRTQKKPDFEIDTTTCLCPKCMSKQLSNNQ